MAAEREQIAPHLEAEPDKSLAFIAEMDIGAPEGAGPVVYACPMHPEVVEDEPGHCPKCGMKLLAGRGPHDLHLPMHPEVVEDEPGHCPECGMKLLPSQLVAEAGGGDGTSMGTSTRRHDHAAADGIEWEDDMVEVNRITTPANMRWKLIDRETDTENHDIDWHSGSATG